MSNEKRQYTLADLSARYDLELLGSGDHTVSGVGTLMTATSKSARSASRCGAGLVSA